MQALTVPVAALIANAQLYLAWVVGIAVALLRWRRHPQVSLLLSIGLATLLVVSLGLTMFNTLTPYLAFRLGWGSSQMRVALSSVGGLARVVEALAWAAVLVAVFGWRQIPSFAQEDM